MNIEERREHNRAYMRVWRASPEHAEQQRHWHRIRRLKIVHLKGLCMFCRRRPAVTDVVRLNPTSEGFVPIKVRYCGEC